MIDHTKKLSKNIAAAFLACSIAFVPTASVYAAGNGLLDAVMTSSPANNASFENGAVTVVGEGVAPQNAVNMAQGRILARRAAVVDAYRQLAESISGVSVDSETTVEKAIATSDITKTKVAAIIKGAQVTHEEITPDGGYRVTMTVPMFGVTGSLASAVMTPPAVKESFPAPVPNVAPSMPSVQVNVNVGGEQNVHNMPAPPSVEAPSWNTSSPSNGSSAASAPNGNAIGGYSGLIVDCRGLGLKPVMSPVIKNESGQPIYGYKNLNYDMVVEKGMVGYTSDITRAPRAGSNPLVVKALSLDNHNGNPVISTADANRVLIENGATGFLDRTNVVFVR